MNENVTYIMSEKKYDRISSVTTFTALILVLLLFFTFFGVSIVSGISMVPTFQDKDTIMFRASGAKSLAYDDIIVLLPNDKNSDYIHNGFDYIRRAKVDREMLFVKRVIGLPGDVIEIHDGNVWRNGERLDDSYTAEGTSGTFGPYTVEEGKVFCLGDNREYSGDSRTFGAFPMSGVVGRVFLHG